VTVEELDLLLTEYLLLFGRSALYNYFSFERDEWQWLSDHYLLGAAYDNMIKRHQELERRHEQDRLRDLSTQADRAAGTGA
jgi:hypothetical protein